MLETIVTKGRRAAGRVRATLLARNADVVLKSDGAGWILDQFCRQLAVELEPRLRVVAVTTPILGMRRKTVHFVGSECFYDPAWHRDYDASNRLIGLWWHGSERSAEATIRTAVENMRANAERLNCVHVTCAISADTVRRQGVPEQKIALVPMGVDRRLFLPSVSRVARNAIRESLGISPGAIVIGSFQKDGVGWDDGEEPKLVKGPDVFAEVVARVARRYPAFALIPGPARGFLRRRLADAGVPFRNDGFVPFTDMLRFYHACDVYLMTGREEGGPAALLEALASGVPFVGHRSGMAPDVIEHGVSGYLADVDDVDALVAGVEALCDSEQKRDEFAAAGSSRVARYAWPVVAREYERLYDRVRGWPSTANGVPG